MSVRIVRVPSHGGRERVAVACRVLESPRHDTRTPCTCPRGVHRREGYVSGECQRDYSREYIRELAGAQ